MDRRQLLAQLGAVSCFASPFQARAEALRRKVKITDVKVMIIRGTWDWNLIKIETDSGVHGIGEGYWGPGVKDMILKRFREQLIGEDPLNVVKLATKLLFLNGGYGAIGGVTVHASSGIEIALWDLAGRLLGVPVCDLLGGRFRDKVRFYRTFATPPKSHPEDPRSWGDQAAQARADNPFGFTAFKFQGDSVPRTADPTYSEPGHDPYTNQFTNKDIARLVDRMDRVRAALGPDIDMAIECHWKYTVNEAIQYCNAVEHVKPMWVEDPTPPENPETMARVARATNTPICTGENLYLLAGFRELIEKEACAGVHLDIPKMGGLFEAKRVSDFADLYGIWTAAHNPASPVGTAASAHAASSMRNFRIHELANWVDWWPTLVTREGPFWKDGYFHIEDKPGLGFDINPDVAKAHLAPGEEWWG
ncbi:MAG TPA: mandelate racemase/muconate lactonizing enzyme family protein [Rhizomicrobium sp.]|nr:mandelate racemase/muconate lactonizing enzyme family protein [Rhizomicrobium sp.]